MAVMRNVLLAGSQNIWLREKATRFWFVRRTVSRFMPGETVEDAIHAARTLRDQGVRTVFTYLGENVKDRGEAVQVGDRYLNVLERIRAANLQTEVSVKLTHLGLDLSADLCYQNLIRLVEHAHDGSVVWIDMEASNYVDVTLDLFSRARQAYPNVGVCLQAYLYRTEKDVASLIPLGAAIRLVKGAYQEPPDVAFPRKRDVDENYFALAKQLLSDEARRAGVRAAIGTHDRALILKINEYADSIGLAKDAFEFQMLYGIQRAEQVRLAQEGR